MSKIEDIMANWENDGVYRDWYAVDCMRANEDAKQPMKVTRIYVGDRERAAEIASERVTGLNLTFQGEPCEPGALGEAPFYRMTLITPEMAHDYFAGIMAGVGDGRMLTMAEAAKKTGVAKQSIHERITRGRMTAEEVGGAWRILDATLALWTPEK